MGDLTNLLSGGARTAPAVAQQQPQRKPGGFFDAFIGRKGIPEAQSADGIGEVLGGALRAAVLGGLTQPETARQVVDTRTARDLIRGGDLQGAAQIDPVAAGKVAEAQSLVDDRARSAKLRRVRAALAGGGTAEEQVARFRRLAGINPDLFSEEDMRVATQFGIEALKRNLEDPPPLTSTTVGKVITTGDGVFLAKPDGTLQRVGDPSSRFTFTKLPGGFVRRQDKVKGSTAVFREGDPDSLDPESVGLGDFGTAGAQAQPAFPAEPPAITGTRQEKSAEAGAQNFETRLAEAQKDAVQARASLEEITRAKPLIDRAITGSAADARRQLAQMVQLLTGEEDAAIADTNELIGITAAFVGQAIQAFGSGTGLSDADREFARAMAANDLSRGRLALKRIINIVERESRRKIENFNELRANAPTQSAFPAIDIPGETSKSSLPEGTVDLRDFIKGGQ